MENVLQEDMKAQRLWRPRRLRQTVVSDQVRHGSILQICGHESAIASAAGTRIDNVLEDVEQEPVSCEVECLCILL